MKMYIAVLDEFPDYMTPTLVAHSVLSAHLKFYNNPIYQNWLNESFKKCVVRVNQKEFDKISALEDIHLGHENNTLSGKKSCVVVCPMNDDIPNVLKFAKLWKPNGVES
jgi:peptidyl-tRNA hydrolase